MRRKPSLKIFKDWTFVVHVNSREVGNRWCFRTRGIKLLPILRTFTLLRHFRHHLLRCSPNESAQLSRRRKFRSPKMNLNAFLCCFPTVFGKYITILDQVRKIRYFTEFHLSFRDSKIGPKFVSSLSVFHTVSRSCEPSVSWFAVYRMCNETVAIVNAIVNAIKITNYFWCFRRVLMF